MKWVLQLFGEVDTNTDSNAEAKEQCIQRKKELLDASFADEKPYIVCLNDSDLQEKTTLIKQAFTLAPQLTSAILSKLIRKVWQKYHCSSFTNEEPPKIEINLLEDSK